MGFKRDDFTLIPHPDKERYPDQYSIVIDPTGERSAFYSKSECEEIIKLAIEHRLYGSFGMP